MKEIVFKNNLMYFIEDHKDWKELLASDPYNLIIKEKKPNFKQNTI